MKKGMIADEWKIACIVPIHRKGQLIHPASITVDQYNLKSIYWNIYIPVATFSHLEQYDILCDNQYGFRRGYG